MTAATSSGSSVQTKTHTRSGDVGSRRRADAVARSVAARIDDKVLRGGARMPSIRQFAASHAVSCFTVVASYDKLVARGYLESRRGAGQPLKSLF